MKLRVATAADIPAVARVFAACWRDAYPGILADEVVARFDEPAAIELWTALLGAPGPGRLAVVAESVAGEVVGVVRFGREPEAHSRGHVFGLYVAPDSAGAGAGGALLDRAGEWFAAEGLREATLWVFEANAHARGFYLRRGWRPDGGARVEPQFGAPEVRLRRQERATGGPRR